MRVLVTGGAGSIGSVVTARLLEEGHAVTVLDDLSTGHADAVGDGATLAQGTIHEAGALLERGDFAVVVHLAASSIVAESISDPERYRFNNVVGTERLLAAMHAAGTRRIVFSSSAAVYGEPDIVPIEEDAPTNPVNPYGASKLADDRALAAAAAKHGFGAVSFRYFNVAGAHGRLGERHDPETHLIPLALRAVLGRSAALTVFGEDYPTADGTCVRDYIHVADLADAHLLALGATAEAGHRVYNLGNGAGFSVREVLAAVGEVTGRAVPTTLGPRREGDPAVLVASSARAHAELGWAPRRNDLREMVADAWRPMAGAHGR